MLIPKMPIRQYARSSILVVFLLAAHDILWATLAVSTSSSPTKMPTGILVIFDRASFRVSLVPISFQS
ncbi:hypothetical protein BDV26DRAFT_250735 [Aspergillus bertholletiae]|uniref:Uncharacterized protein n=1 Tax=Aspergillus bertholletiae TaxID=1226010 RepID=A0A5N7BPI8_9EURO|nr:hypothetical protein BDV26DRAFT_250735 [Aspergillus bertholletiae]